MCKFHSVAVGTVRWTWRTSVVSTASLTLDVDNASWVMACIHWPSCTPVWIGTTTQSIRAGGCVASSSTQTLHSITTACCCTVAVAGVNIHRPSAVTSHRAKQWALSRENGQWRSKALRGPGSTVTWGPSLSLPSTFPSLPFPSPFSSSSQPSPARNGPQIQLYEVWGAL